MKIREIRTTIVSIRRRHTLKTVYGEMPSTTTVIARVFTDEGLIGVGQTIAPAPWYGDTAESIKSAIDRFLGPAILGEDPFEIEPLYQRMHKALRGSRFASTAVEMALWDIKGQALNVPVYQLLGGASSAGAPLHAFVERLDAGTTAARVNEYHADGWRWFKTKIGFGEGADIAWYRELRDAVPADALFQLDGNTGYTLAKALQTLVKLEQIGNLALVEQPVRYLDEMAILASRLATPIQADEALTSPRSVYEIAKAGAAHVLHFKLQKYGGISQAQRMAAVAEAAGLEISVAPYFDIMAAAAAHFAAATPIARWPAGFSDMEDTILEEPFQPGGQVLTPPDEPGLGVRIDAKKLAYFEALQEAI